jgi:hypothetical protein
LLISWEGELFVCHILEVKVSAIIESLNFNTLNFKLVECAIDLIQRLIVFHEFYNIRS